MIHLVQIYFYTRISLKINCQSICSQLPLPSENSNIHIGIVSYFFFYHFCSQIDLFKIAYNPSSRMNLLWTQLYQRTPVCPVYTSWVNATECDINCYTVKVVYTHSTSTLPLYSTVYLTCVNQALGQFILVFFVLYLCYLLLWKSL